MRSEKTASVENATFFCSAELNSLVFFYKDPYITCHFFKGKADLFSFSVSLKNRNRSNNSHNVT